MLRGCGHMVPTDQPVRAHEMIRAFLVPFAPLPPPKPKPPKLLKSSKLAGVAARDTNREPVGADSKELSAPGVAPIGAGETGGQRGDPRGIRTPSLPIWSEILAQHRFFN